jgi:hypothetical protein
MTWFLVTIALALFSHVDGGISFLVFESIYLLAELGF